MGEPTISIRRSYNGPKALRGGGTAVQRFHAPATTRPFGRHTTNCDVEQSSGRQLEGIQVEESEANRYVLRDL